MRVFFDSNIWIAAFGTNGLCKELVELAIGLSDSNQLGLLLCPRVEQEVFRTLGAKFHLTTAELDPARKLLSRLIRIDDSIGEAPSAFPDPDDWPILTAALRADAELFVTGDKALLTLGEIDGLPILDPRTAYLKLRGLD